MCEGDCQEGSQVPLEGDAEFISVIDVDVWVSTLHDRINSKYPLRFKNSGTIRAHYDLLLRALFIKVMVSGWELEYPICR